MKIPHKYKAPDVITYMRQEIPSAIAYWADVQPDEHIPGAWTVDAHDEEGRWLLSERYHLQYAATTWAKEAQHHENKYQARAARDILNKEWDNLDYDAQIIDMIVQTLLYGRIKFS